MEKQKQKKVLVKWTSMKDNFLISEIFAEKPYEKRACCVAWENIAKNLNLTVNKDTFKANNREV